MFFKILVHLQDKFKSVGIVPYLNLEYKTTDFSPIFVQKY